MNFFDIHVLMEKIELLAPAKDKVTAIIAIESGADAIYIGAPSFGARKSASNSIDDIKEVVDYAHKFNVKVHVTVNTILKDNEISDVTKLIEKLYDIGVDALIIQDMAIVKLAIEHKLPPIVLHISTQCDNRDLEKVKFFEWIGLSRVVLARELSIEQIKNISKNVDIELETFIHGALCVSYSGQCYLSYLNGGRSANRGECAQPCRKKYTLINDKGKVLVKDKHLLSLKDFNASKNISDLINAGVKSFKIEGRLKDKNYVRNVVSFYRKEIDKFALKTSSGKVFCDFEPDVNKSFNRGFTTYFLNKRENCFSINTPKMRGERIGKVIKSGLGWVELENTSAELHPQDGICYFDNNELSGCLVNKTSGNKIFINKKITINKGTQIFRNYDFEYDKKLSVSKTKRRIGVKFVYENNNLIVSDEDNNTISLPVLSEEPPKNPEKMKETLVSQLNKTGDSDFYVLSVEVKDEFPFVPVSEINKLRRDILNDLMIKRLQNYKRETQKPLKYTEFTKEKLDYRGNVYNNIAKDFYKNCNCNITEPAFEALSDFSGKELMRTKHCLKYALNMCKAPDSLFLIDEKGKKYKLKFDCKNCEMVIINDSSDVNIK